jgi:hypothetical protein
MTIIPYESSGGAIGLKYYMSHIFWGSDPNVPSYQTWLKQNGGILLHNNHPMSEWKIIFKNDCDLLIFKLKYGI